jgi:tight adherence protein B
MISLWIALTAAALGLAVAQCSWRSLWVLVPMAIAFDMAGLSPLWLFPSLLLWLTPALWRKQWQTAQLSRLEGDLPTVCEAAAASLRAGLSLENSWTAALNGATGPLRDLDQALRRRLALGLALEQAVLIEAQLRNSELLERIGRALDLSRQTGLDSGKLLDNLAEEVRDDAAGQERLRSLSAQGRLQSWVLGAMPFALLAILAVMEPERIAHFLNDPRGRFLIGLALVLEAVAILWIRKLVKV